jgi:hypothetical protein
MMGKGNARNIEFFYKIKFGKFLRLVGFIKNKFVTMHGHMNVLLLSFYILVIGLMIATKQ